MSSYVETEQERQYHQLVVKSNDMIQRATNNLTATQQKLVAYAISKIRPDDKEFQFYEIRVDEFCAAIGKNKNWFYQEFKDIVDDMDSRASLWIETDDVITKFRFFSEIEYLKGKGTIRVLFHSHLKKYLLQLSERFTQYELYNVLALKSKYSFSLFELLKSYSNMQLKRFDLDELKTLVGADSDAYKNFSNFKNRVLEPAIKEINRYTELNLEYETITKGKKVVAIIFHIKKKTAIGAKASYMMTMEKINNGINQIPGQIDMEL